MLSLKKKFDARAKVLHMHPVVVLEESRALYWDRNSEMTQLGGDFHTDLV